MHPVIILGIVAGLAALILMGGDDEAELSEAERLTLLREEMEVARQEYEYLSVTEQRPANDPEVVAMLNRIRELAAEIQALEAPVAG
jgi:hypothetical protein